MLSILVGPLLLTLVQTGLERGVAAGLWVGIGIWTSDLLFILGVYLGGRELQSWQPAAGFTWLLGAAGSLLLLGLGLAILLSKPTKLDEMPTDVPPQGAELGQYWLKGFLINTINPFTFFFWIGLMGATLLERGLNSSQAIAIFGGIMLTLVVTDSLKVVLAKRIRRYLQPHHLRWSRRIVGAAFVVFALILLIRSLRY